MAKLSHAQFDGDPARYSTVEWEGACVLDHGPAEPVAKRRWGVPVREPDGRLNQEALQKAADRIRDTAAHELVKDDARERLQKRFVKAGLPATVTVEKSALTGKQRKTLPASDFVFPDTREYPIPDAKHARNAVARGAQNETGDRLAKIRAAVKRRYPDVEVTKADLDRTVQVWKDDSKQIVYGVVLTPGLRDSQGDVCSPEEIEKAAHRWLVEYRNHDVQHAEVTKNFDGQPFAEVVESFIAPSDMEIAGEHVLKGSWVLATHVIDPDTWDRVMKGEITGYSIGGTGERVPLAA